MMLARYGIGVCLLLTFLYDEISKYLTLLIMLALMLARYIIDPQCAACRSRRELPPITKRTDMQRFRGVVQST